MSEMTIQGLGPITVQYTEYLSSNILVAYGTPVATIKSILDKRADSTPPQTPTAADYDALVAALQDLADLGKNGVQDTSNGITYTTYMSGDMGDNINEIMKSLAIVGFPPDQPLTSAQKVQMLTEWQSLAGFGVETVLIKAVNYATQQIIDPTRIDPATGKAAVVSIPIGRTLQSMVEVEYVKAGNDVLATQFNAMNSALMITQRIIQTLGALQIISNQILVQPKVLPSANSPSALIASGIAFIDINGDLQFYQYDAEEFQNYYTSRASAYFKQIPLIANPSPTAAGDLYRAKLELENELALLQASNPSQSITSSSSLASYVYKVLQDISAQFVAITSNSTFGVPASGILNYFNQNPTNFNTLFKSAVVNWILDGGNFPAADAATTKAGSIQNNLSLAISNTENLNDKQKDTVQRYLYIFQQFYKSASAMLQNLEDAIEKFGKGIAGRG